MPVAYTPGLRVTPDALIRQTRRLPMRGETLVRLGEQVSAEAVVARAEMPGNVETVRAAQILHVEPEELASFVVKGVGEAVRAGEVLAQTRGLWGLFRSEVRSPVAGAVEEVSTVSGHVRVRQKPRSIEVRAHIAGRITEVLEGEGAVIEARGALVQGIFGVGGERRGRLHVITEGSEEIMRPEAVADCQGCVLVAGAGADGAALARAAEAGAAGLVIGAVSDAALREYVGYDIGVAITGQEDVPMTLILTEGFGELPMARRTWELLRSLEGRVASINGATQIRAGVIRPEMVVTHEEEAEGAPEPDREQVLQIGSRVRVIRDPHFGALGRVSGLPPELTEIETESRVRVARVRLDVGEEVRVPRANLELIRE
jgi:hypothetical protein